MKTIRVLKNKKENIDLMLKFNEEYNKIIATAEKIDGLYWEVEKDDLTEHLIKDIAALICDLTKELELLFTLENDLLYIEMETSRVKQSSVSALRCENDNILIMCEGLKRMLCNRKNRHIDKELLQASMITLADLIIRNARKKEKVLFKEAKEILSKEKIDFIKKEMVDKLEFLNV